MIETRILRHLPQKISKPHFSVAMAPEENPLPGETSPCEAYELFSFFIYIVSLYILPETSHGRIPVVYI